MRYVRYLCIAIFAIALIAVALANRSMVSLKLLPTEVSGWFALNPEIQVPLFINEGDQIRIDTRTGEYADRVSKR